ncbi:MAG: hypothetical protein ACYC6A_12590 [Armatimonadota bacterium]
MMGFWEEVDGEKRIKVSDIAYLGIAYEKEYTPMTDEQVIPIYLDLSPDIQQVLSDNGISVTDILREKNIAVEVTYGILPGEEDDGVRSRDVVPIILASSSAVLAIGAAIAMILRVYLRRPRVVEIYNPVELRDAVGNVLLDKTGQPIFKWVKTVDLLEPLPENSQREFKVDGPGIKFKFKEAEQQIATPEKTGSA